MMMIRAMLSTRPFCLAIDNRPTIVSVGLVNNNKRTINRQQITQQPLRHNAGFFCFVFFFCCFFFLIIWIWYIITQWGFGNFGLQLIFWLAGWIRWGEGAFSQRRWRRDAAQSEHETQEQSHLVTGQSLRGGAPPTTPQPDGHQDHVLDAHDARLAAPVTQKIRLDR